MKVAEREGNTNGNRKTHLHRDISHQAQPEKETLLPSLQMSSAQQAGPIVPADKISKNYNAQIFDTDSVWSHLLAYNRTSLLNKTVGLPL